MYIFISTAAFTIFVVVILICIPWKKVEDDKSSFPFRREPKGLKNLGNTCYMNSVLQVLMWTPMLRESLDKQWKQCKGLSSNAYKNAPHTGHLLDLCNYLHFPDTNTQQSPSSIAKKILESVQIAHPQFQKDKQNDSFLLFLALIGGIEDEFMKFRKKQGEEDFVMNNSPVSRLFGGRFMTEWYYEKCCHVECSLHKFTSLTIPVTTGGQGTAKYSIENGLSELLSKQEWPEGLFKCARCEGSSKVQSKMLINTLPPVLVVHINRFEESPDGRLKKLKTKVMYNHTLEVKPFCYMGTDDSSTTYSLYGVVSHSGNISSGHYTAYVKLRPKTKMELPLAKTWVNQTKLKETIEKELNEKYKSDVPQWMTSKSKLHTSTEPQTNSEDTWYWISDSRYTKMHSSLALDSDGAYLLMYEQIQ